MQYVFSSKELSERAKQYAQPYYEFLMHPALSSGIYILKAGEPDLQQPHTEDEVYYVLDGRSKMTIGKKDFSIEKGDVIYVPAYKEHRFYDILEDIKLLVFFSSAPSTGDE